MKLVEEGVIQTVEIGVIMLAERAGRYKWGIKG